MSTVELLTLSLFDQSRDNMNFCHFSSWKDCWAGALKKKNPPLPNKDSGEKEILENKQRRLSYTTLMLMLFFHFPGPLTPSEA